MKRSTGHNRSLAQPAGHEEAGPWTQPPRRYEPAGATAAQRPDIDADMIAHLMLGSLHSEAVLDQLTTDGPARVAAAMRAVACAVLDVPAPDVPAPGTAPVSAAS